MFQRAAAVVVVVLLAGLGAPARAEGVYAGASWLSSGAEFDTAFDNFDTDDSGWKVFAGWDIVKFVGVEVSYRDLGSFSETSGTNFVNADITAYDGAARGILPLGKHFEVFAKIGYSSVSVDLESGDGTSLVSGSSDEWDLFYGLGVGLKFGERFGVRAEWEEWDVDTTLNAFSVGAFLKF